MEIIISKLSTVTLLEPSTGTTSTKLLRLAPSWIRYKQSSIVPNQYIFNLLLALLINILLIESDESLRYALPYRVNLRGVTSTLHSDPHVHASKTVSSEEEDWLVSLESEDLRFNEFNWAAVDLD